MKVMHEKSCSRAFEAELTYTRDVVTEQRSIATNYSQLLEASLQKSFWDFSMYVLDYVYIGVLVLRANMSKPYHVVVVTALQ